MSTEPFKEPARDETPPAPTATAGTPDSVVSRAQGRATPAPGTDTAGRPGTAAGTQTAPRSEVTRAGVVWVSVAVALVLLVGLIVFILQNQDVALVHFLGFEGSVPVGMALFIAAVAGGVLVGIAGAVRITQLRLRDRRQRRA
ncbi:DUF1049 domain-containing protein [Paenarthrobacter sp. DKR-5]|uniref:LapA family protein n=1 Tax=Paenarthrobacter sp. DKR-5 TaxID=2835535 RepID=UPI001BDD4074|nr:lipopolysaccharide assembly protein LapA domain-containing protein [Paenarthrobacter sp. DKR-5]MBT1001379.1 DUF1049 domain-containing protein [Paenarthrobacter sp. DKR-5]